MNWRLQILRAKIVDALHTLALWFATRALALSKVLAVHQAANIKEIEAEIKKNQEKLDAPH